jgi:putative thymidine phosphorylase
LTNNLVDLGEVWITHDIFDKYEIKRWDTVFISTLEKNPLSLQAIKKKLLGKKLNEDEIKSLMRDMTDGKISDLLVAYYAACSFAYPSDEEELYLTAKYSAEMWDMIKFEHDTAVKYCIGGVPWNETTMLIVPILGSLWISSPKTFSKAITSPAATGECVEVLMDTEFSVKEMKDLVNKTGSCLANGKSLKFAPANDKIIKVSYPLYMEAYAKVAVSIMAKIYAGWTKYCLIDLPVGKNWKISDKKTAKRIAWHFEYIWKKLGMKVKVDITNADNPVGKWIGAVLQTREALRILQNKKTFSKDIKKKAISLSAQLIELVWLARWDNAIQLAKKQLESWDAWEYMQKLIESQNKIHDVKPDYKNISYLWSLDSEELPLAKFSDKLIAKKSGKIKSMDVELLKKICRIFGAPLDKQSWFYLNKQVWEAVKKWEVLCQLYANDKNDLKRGMEILGEKELCFIS